MNDQATISANLDAIAFILEQVDTSFPSDENDAALRALEQLRENCPACGCKEWEIDYMRTEDGEMKVKNCAHCLWPPSTPMSPEAWVEENRDD